MTKQYDFYLIQLENNKLNWWEYARKVPTKFRPPIYSNYWTYLRNRKTASKRWIKEAEWRMEARRKGLLDY
ncbi:hypothetical protein [Pseudalkalibacillus decolorationis]|uniref:hypothetical protein n=1 Tax=Pseudalkalibacillus decolorationis TaxID=163879 RepID=UPI00214793B7|nr:hypothetical protein [Pseudalkalibacillus decolorationis]